MSKTSTPRGQRTVARHGRLTSPGPLAQLFRGVAIALAVIWIMVGPMVQSSILWIGWPIVGVVTVLQTLLMFSKLVRRHHGFKV